jgi:hypothetical protein
MALPPSPRHLARGEPSPGGLQRFLRSHPVVLLLLLTPGIPEYLSGSSAVNALILNPPLFLFQIAANAGLYGSGALLIHEAKVRWRKGWGAVLILGLAYGILEEGVALSTLFDPTAGPVGTLGVYGHWLGVNWVWAAGIVPFHAVFSIALPIILLGLAVPDTKGRRLLSDRGTAATVVILAADVVALMAFVRSFSGYWMGTPILLSSLATIVVLVLAAKRLPGGTISSRAGPPMASNRSLFVVGLSFFPVILLAQGLGRTWGIPAALDFVLVLLTQAAYLAYIRAKVGRVLNQRALISLGIGLIIPIATLGFLSELSLPLILLADALAILFFRSLWSTYGPGEPAFVLSPPPEMSSGAPW